MRAKLASDTGHWWLYSTGTVTTYGIGYYYG